MWLVGGRRATQGAVATAVRKEGLLLCCCTCRLAVGSAIAPPYLLCRSRASLLGLLPKAVFLVFFRGEITEVMDRDDSNG